MNSPTTNHLTPQEMVLQRVTSLFTRTDLITAHLTDVITRMIDDSVALRGKVNAADFPDSLEEDSLAELMRVKKNLEDIRDYHKAQMVQLQDTIAAARAAAPSMAEAVSGLTAVAKEIESQLPKADSPVEQLRKREESAADLRARLERRVEEGEPMPARPESPAKPPASASLLETSGGKVASDRALGEASGGLPATVELQDRASPSPMKPVNPVAALSPEHSPEQGLARLFGENSPLLDILAAGPWLPQGKGRITVGSTGFKWYKGTDPVEQSPTERATLPSGFYSGTDKPRYVLLRLKSSIIIWTFALEPEAALCYIVGLSDAEIGREPRWFKPTELSASFTRRLVHEITEAHKALYSAV